MTFREREISFGLLEQVVSSPSRKWYTWSIFGNIYHMSAEPDSMQKYEHFFTNIVDRGIEHVVSVLTDYELSTLSETIFPPAMPDNGAISMIEVGEWTIEHIAMFTNKIAVVHNIRVHSKKNLFPPHDLTHTQVNVWADGALLSADVFQDVFLYYSQSCAESTTLVHCKHGLGRSASLIVIHALMTSIKLQLHMGTKEPKVSIFDAVSKLRKVRAGVIGNVDHYINLHNYLHAVQDILKDGSFGCGVESNAHSARKNLCCTGPIVTC